MSDLTWVANQYNRWNQVVWYIEMFWYNVYLSLLLRLRNDVDEDPDSTKHDIFDGGRRYVQRFVIKVKVRLEKVQCWKAT